MATRGVLRPSRGTRRDERFAPIITAAGKPPVARIVSNGLNPRPSCTVMVTMTTAKAQNVLISVPRATRRRKAGLPINRGSTRANPPQADLVAADERRAVPAGSRTSRLDARDVRAVVGAHRHESGAQRIAEQTPQTVDLSPVSRQSRRTYLDAKMASP